MNVTQQHTKQIITFQGSSKTISLSVKLFSNSFVDCLISSIKIKIPKLTKSCPPTSYNIKMKVCGYHWVEIIISWLKP